MAQNDDTIAKGSAIRKLLEQISQRDKRLSWLRVENERLVQQSTDKQQALEALSEQVAEREQQVKALIAQVAEREQRVEALTVLVAECEQQLREITMSKAWRVAMLLRRMLVFFLPPGSWRAPLAKKMLSLLLFPFRILRTYKVKRDMRLIRNSIYFDEEWYLAHNPDVVKAEIDPARHYLLFGGFEDRDPGPNFSSTGYLRTYEDVKKARTNPLVQYLKFLSKRRIGRIPARDFLWRRKTILFFPELPPEETVEYKLCMLLGHEMTSNPNHCFDVPFKRKAQDFFNQADLQRIPTNMNKIINANSIDISKHAVGEAFADVFGYALDIDPTQYHGRIVEKSNKNATHDGRVIKGPISPEDVRAGRIYQKEIDNTSDEDGFVFEYRVPIHGDQIPLVFLRYRPIEIRFASKNTFVEMEEPSVVFSPTELDNILLLARKMGVDYGELDVLRDKDERIYVVDVNNTPYGPPNGLPEFERKIALERMAKTFDHLLETRIS